jgi:glycosyltransferase involved in cell wall biosynthesis
MKIVVDLRHLTKPEPSGIGLYTLELLRALFNLDKNNEYFLFSSGSSKARNNLPLFDFPNVKSVHLNLPNRLLNFLLLTTGRPRFDELLADKIGRDEKPLFFFPNLNIVSLRPYTPYVLTLHDLSFEIFPEFYQNKSRLWHHLTHPRRLAQNAQAIIVPSKSAAGDVNSIFGVPQEKIFVVPHGVSAIFSPKAEPQDHGIKSKYRLPKKIALFVGAAEARKNITAMAAAVEKYRRATGDDLRLVVTGKTIGYVPARERPALYRLADVVLFPSFYEGFGLPIVEAMACGTPVIAGNTSSMPEVGGRAAIYVDPYKEEDLTAALRELLSNEEFKKQKIAQGLERAKEFSWEKAAEQTKEILNKISIV